jgi:hypothetical protein
MWTRRGIPRTSFGPALMFVGCTGVLIADAVTAPGGFRWTYVVAAVPDSRVKITLAAIIVFVVLECAACLLLLWWRVAHAPTSSTQGSRTLCALCHRCVLHSPPTHSPHVLQAPLRRVHSWLFFLAFVLAP